MISKDLEHSIGYCRVSTQRQSTDGHGLERYISALKDYGLRDEQIYWDIESGNSDSRQGYRRVLDLVKMGNIKNLIIPYFSRFTRSSLHFEQEIEELKNTGIMLIFLDGGQLGLEKPDDLFNLRLKSALAARERDTIVHNTREGIRYFRAQEKVFQAIFGFKKVADTLIINQDLYKTSNKSYFQVAEDMINYFCKTRSLSGTVREFNNLYGQEFTKSNTIPDHPHSHGGFRKWLLHPMLRGYLVYFNEDSVKRILIPDKFERILSEEKYEEICRILEKPNLTQRKKPTVLNPLMGLIYCAGCGGNMRVFSSRPLKADGTKAQYNYVLCRNAYPEPGKLQTCGRRSSYSLVLESCVSSTISALCSRADEIANQAIQHEETKDSSPELEEIRQQIKKLIALNDPDLQEAIQIKQTKLENLLTSLKKENMSAGFNSRYELMKQYAAMPQLWQQATVEELRILFQDLVKRVVCNHGQVSVELLI
jgi:DNA invertase Pin-like site-specific DNA recombinase